MKAITSKKYSNLNKITKRCLKGTDNIEKIDDFDDITLRVIDDDSRVLGELNLFSDEDTAGVFTHMHSDLKTLKEKEEVLRFMVNSIWDVSLMNHNVLVIHVYATESGIDCSILEHMGFVGRAGLGSEYYTMFNPNFVEMVRSLGTTSDDKDSLLKLYNVQQKGSKYNLACCSNVLRM